MGLREIAAADNRAILEDTAGFGWPIKVTNPAGTVRNLLGFSSDVWQAVDVGTGQIVSGRSAQVTISLAALAAAGLAIPVGVSDPTANPWVVEFTDTAGNIYKFKVSEGRPDRMLGCVLCTLEGWKT